MNKKYIAGLLLLLSPLIALLVYIVISEGRNGLLALAGMLLCVLLMAYGVYLMGNFK